MKATDSPIIVTQTFDQSIQKVWDAITQLDSMRQWFFENIPEFKPELNFETRFLIINEGRQFTHISKIKKQF